LQAALSVPVTIACRPKPKEINCRIVKERTGQPIHFHGSIGQRGKFSREGREVNTPCRGLLKIGSLQAERKQ
jgi:hypothetical protein